MSPTRGEVITRSMPVALRAADESTSGREFHGIAVPWNQVIEVWGEREQFAPGSVVPAENVLVCYRHDDPVGRLTGHADTAAGWEVDGLLSDTTLARDAATLLRDGVIDRLSIAFLPEEWLVEKGDDGVDVITYTRVTVREVSLVPFPAYSGAAITEVRHQQHPKPSPQEETPMPENDTAELRSALEDLARTVEMIGSKRGTETDPHPLAKFRSMGEYVKAVAKGDESATRAYAGLTLGEIIPEDGPAWANDMVKIIEARTPTLSMFTHTKDLPPSTMLQHGTVHLNNGLKVAEQLLEGDDLVFGKIAIDPNSVTTPKTVGGWTDMSRQSIELQPLNVVDLMWRAFAVKYAESLEATAAAALKMLYDQQVAAAGDNVLTADLTTANGIIDFLVDISMRFEASPFSFDVLYVAPDVFKTMAKIDQTPKALQLTSAPTNSLGTATASNRGLTANLGGITVKAGEGMAAGTAFAADSMAIKVQESPGAPFKLQDENIVNLTKQFSVYGYVAAYTEFPEALVPVVAAGAGA